MANGGRLDRLARLYRVGEALDERALGRQARAELDALYPDLLASADPRHAHHARHHAIIGALMLAEEYGGRVPGDTPPLGPTLEALVTRDTSVTLPESDGVPPILRPSGDGRVVQ